MRKLGQPAVILGLVLTMLVSATAAATIWCAADQ